MTEAAEQYRRRADTFERLIAAAPPERWERPSPCHGWTARDVVAHVVDYSAKVLREKAGIREGPSFEAPDDPLAAFRATRAVVERLLEDPATPPKVVTHLVWSLSFDLPQHGWDLAKATGQDATMDADEVELLWGSLTGDPRSWDWQRASGWYGPPIAVPGDAPLQDRVLGRLGRDPTWQASA